MYVHIGILKSYYNKSELSHKILYANLNSYSLLVPSTAFRRQSKLTHTHVFTPLLIRLQQSNLSQHQLGLSLVIKDMCFLGMILRLPVYNSEIN